MKCIRFAYELQAPELTDKYLAIIMMLYFINIFLKFGTILLQLQEKINRNF